MSIGRPNTVGRYEVIRYQRPDHANPLLNEINRHTTQFQRILPAEIPAKIEAGTIANQRAGFINTLTDVIHCRAIAADCTELQGIATGRCGDLTGEIANLPDHYLILYAHLPLPVRLGAAVHHSDLAGIHGSHA